MGRKIKSRSTSTLMVDHTLAPVLLFHASFAQVSCPGSLGPGIVWNVQTNLPVRTLYARTAPLGPLEGYSGTAAPVITRSLKIASADVTAYSACGNSSATPARRFTAPLLPKSRHGFPLFASRQIMRPSKVP